MKLPRAVIIIPTYNERENILELIPILLEIFSHITTFDMHVLVVDDSSPDKTGDAVKTFEKKYPNVHLLSNQQKQGLGHAYLIGMGHAVDKLSADVMFELDADFSHDPKKIPEFLVAIEEGADLVLGSRYIKGGSIPADWGFYRKFLSKVGNLVNTIVLTNFTVHDWTTGYRAIKREVFEALREEMSVERFSGYTFQIGFLHKALRKGFKVKEVPIHFIDRKVGESKLGPDYIKNALQYILIARFKEIVRSHVFKFGVVGGIGFLINSICLFVFSSIPQIATLALTLREATNIQVINTSGVSSALGAECAIISNFILNNTWTFADRRPKTVGETLAKALQFNISSFAAVILQFLIVGTGTHYTGDESLSKFFWLVVATAIGMFVNYTIYSKVIWKDKTTRQGASL